MSLAPGEERELAEIEQRLCRSDLRLAARLAIFSRRAIRRGARRRPGNWLTLLTLASTIAVAGVVLLAAIL